MNCLSPIAGPLSEYVTPGMLALYRGRRRGIDV